MNCIECPWFESCDELDESYCINDELNRVKNELEEMEERKMTNEQAIEILANARYADDLQGNEELTTAHYMAIEALKTQPKWIPVEERLPEEHECIDGYMEPSERVLVQLSNGSMRVSRYWGRVIDEPWMDLSYPTTLSVVAWMPLPGLYKAESEEKE